MIDWWIIKYNRFVRAVVISKRYRNAIFGQVTVEICDIPTIGLDGVE